MRTLVSSGGLSAAKALQIWKQSSKIDSVTHMDPLSPASGTAAASPKV